MADYFKERERDVNMRLREIRDTLPEFCDEFFVGVEPQTTVLTRSSSWVWNRRPPC